jgi:4-hydroxy-2-oxoheptanedioate aldolase
VEVVPSVVKQRLAQDLPVLLFCANPTPELRWVEMAAQAGYHGLWIDHEHQNFTDPEMYALCVACRAGGMEPMVRVRKASRGSYFRALEVGANGVMLPHCNTPEEAADCVREIKFPPMGNRSLDGIEPLSGFYRVDPAAYPVQANEQTWLVVQIEEPAGVERVEEIAAVPGVDVVFVGPGDLGLRYKATGAAEGALEDAIARTAEAARKHGKHWGIPVSDLETARKRVDQGARFITWGSVFWYVYSGLKKAEEDLGELLGG